MNIFDMIAKERLSYHGGLIFPRSAHWTLYPTKRDVTWSRHTKPRPDANGHVMTLVKRRSGHCENPEKTEGCAKAHHEKGQEEYWFIPWATCQNCEHHKNRRRGKWYVNCEWLKEKRGGTLAKAVNQLITTAVDAAKSILGEK